MRPQECADCFGPLEKARNLMESSMAEQEPLTGSDFVVAEALAYAHPLACRRLRMYQRSARAGRPKAHEQASGDEPAVSQRSARRRLGSPRRRGRCPIFGAGYHTPRTASLISRTERRAVPFKRGIRLSLQGGPGRLG